MWLCVGQADHLHMCGQMVVGCGGCVWVLGVSALHYSTGNQEGFWTLASACALHLTANYSCPSISGAYWKFQGYPEVLGVVLEFGS